MGESEKSENRVLVFSPVGLTHNACLMSWFACLYVVECRPDQSLLLLSKIP